MDTPEEAMWRTKRKGIGQSQEVKGRGQKKRVAGLKHKLGVSRKVFFRVEQSIKIQQELKRKALKTE